MSDVEMDVAVIGRASAWGLTTPPTRGFAVSSPDTYETRPLGDLDAWHWSDWQRLRAMDPERRSPFFSPAFSQAVARCRTDGHVGIVKRQGEPIAYLPFHRTPQHAATPIGGLYNDNHGWIVDPTTEFDHAAAMVGLGLASYRYHALAGDPLSLAPYHWGTTASYLADLAAHPEGYVQFLETTRETIFKQRKKTRKMVKDLGPARLEIDCRDRSVLQRIIELKREQFRRTYTLDLFSVDWARQLLDEVFDPPGHRCRGMLSVLYAGDTLIAGHYGLIEGDLLHYWFPVYDIRYHQYSPGTALFLAIAQEAQGLGIRQVDFGYGEQPYKLKLTDTITQQAYGRVDRSGLRWWCARQQHALQLRAKRWPLRQTIKPWVRKVWPSLGASRYE